MGHYVLHEAGRIIQVWDEEPTQEDLQQILEADFHEELEEIDGKLSIAFDLDLGEVEITVTSDYPEYCRELTMPLTYRE